MVSSFARAVSPSLMLAPSSVGESVFTEGSATEGFATEGSALCSNIGAFVVYVYTVEESTTDTCFLIIFVNVPSAALTKSPTDGSV